MSDDKMTVTVNGQQVLLHRGMKVKHALIACDQSLYDAAEAGDLAVRDAGGFATAAEIAGLPLPPEPKAVRDGGGE